MVLEQQMSALAKANQVRLARAKLLTRLVDMSPVDGCLWAADLIVDPPEVLRSMEVFDLLVKVRRIGHPTAQKLLRSVGVPEIKRLRDLTPGQRAGVSAALRYRAEFWTGRRAA